VESFLVGLTVRDLKALVCAGTPGSILDITARHAKGHLVYLEVSFSNFTTDAAILGYVIMARDVSYKKQAQQKLQYKALLLSNIREAVVGLDSERRVIYLNAASERIFKVLHSEIFLQPVDSLFTFGWNNEEEETYMNEALAESGLWLGDIAISTKRGRKVFGEVSITSHQEQDNVAPGTLIVIRDIRDRKVVETVLHESENRFKSLVNITSDLVWQLTDENTISYISPKVSDLLGFRSDEICGKCLCDLLPTTAIGTAQAEKLIQTLLSKESFTFEQYNFLTQDGDERVFELSGVPLYGGNGAFFGYQGVIRDITERIAADLKLKQNLREKEVLIKEIHHRVKNNMQIVSSLLFLQTQFIQDPEMLGRIQDSQDRIRSMALVHEKLYQSKDLSSIDFKDYLESLTQHIANTYRNPFIRLEIETDPEGVQLGIDTAVPLGLIVNELVSNTFKHAFANGQRGLVSVCLSVKPSGNTLSVTDNGKGIEHTSIAHYEETSLGMQLVGALTLQLQGKLKISNLNGSSFTLTF
jgi:PAS domain S-box-containing protein